MFVGRRGKNKNGHGMNMFGHFIVKAVFLQLIEDYRINRSGAKVLFFSIINTCNTHVISINNAHNEL